MFLVELNMVEIKKGLIRSVNNIVSLSARIQADQKESLCFPASLVEVAAIKIDDRVIPCSSEVSTQIGLNGSGKVPVRELLTTINRGSNVLGIPIKRVLVNPSFLDKCEVPEELKAVLFKLIYLT